MERPVEEDSPVELVSALEDERLPELVVEAPGVELIDDVTGPTVTVVDVDGCIEDLLVEEDSNPVLDDWL